MSSTKLINQKEYLKRYLSGGSKDSKKKKRRKPKVPGSSGRGLSIVDDNLVSTTVEIEEETDLYELAENAPQVAGVFDDRPIHIQARDKTLGTKWKSLVVDEEPKEPARNDSDASPPRRARKESDSDNSPPRARKRGSDSDVSPPRKASRQDSPKGRRSDKFDNLSPSRKRSKSPKRRSSPPRRSRDDLKRRDRDSKSPALRKRRDSGTDTSLPRKGQRSQSPLRKDKTRARKSNSDSSPPRQKISPRRSKSRRSASPPGMKKGRVRRSPDKKDKRRESSPKRRARGSDSDISPPRSKNNRPSSSSKSDHRRRESDVSPPRRSKNLDSRGRRSVSPPRRGRNADLSPPRRNKIITVDSDLDLSPPRSKNEKRKDLSPPRRRRGGGDSDSDLSPPRVKMEPVSPPRSSSSSAVPSIRIKQEPADDDGPAKTLGGKRAGLQDARTVKSELEALRRKEHDHFKQMSDHVSGRGAQAVFRDRKTGRKRDLQQEEQQNEEEKEAERQKKEEFAKLGRGLVQAEQKAQRLQEALHEAAKPVARYAGDEDLERHLREQEREGDPMLDYLRAKRRKENPGEDKPAYQGPSGPPNRFNIAPGHKWDGVDRSTGYEKKLFASRNAKQASLEESYKWSVADM